MVRGNSEGARLRLKLLVRTGLLCLSETAKVFAVTRQPHSVASVTASPIPCNLIEKGYNHLTPNRTWRSGKIKAPLH